MNIHVKNAIFYVLLGLETSLGYLMVRDIRVNRSQALRDLNRIEHALNTTGDKEAPDESLYIITRLSYAELVPAQIDVSFYSAKDKIDLIAILLQRPEFLAKLPSGTNLSLEITEKDRRSDEILNTKVVDITSLSQAEKRLVEKASHRSKREPGF